MPSIPGCSRPTRRSVWTHDTAIGAGGLARTGHATTAAAVLRSLIDVAAARGYRWPELYSSEPILDVPAPYPASCRPIAWTAASAGLVVSAALGLRADWIAPAPVESGLCRLGGCRGGGEISVVVGLELGGWDVVAVAVEA